MKAADNNATPPAPSAYTLHPLRRYDFDEYHPLVLHLTGRRVGGGGAGTSCDDPTIIRLSPADRLSRILSSGSIQAFPMFGTGIRAACFTENSASAVNWLISEGVYAPWGIAFSKDFLFSKSGGPVIEVRGDEWHHTDNWPAPLAARAKRLWPGAAGPLGTTLPWQIQKESQWSFEREWRVPIENLDFTPSDVEFIICATEADFQATISAVEAANAPMAQHLSDTPSMIWDTATSSLTVRSVSAAGPARCGDLDLGRPAGAPQRLHPSIDGVPSLAES